VVFTGDGGIGMFVAEVKLAVRHQLPLLVVLLSDSFLGTVRGESLKRNLTQAPTTIYGPSWIRAMEGLGVMSERVENSMSLERILGQWTKQGPLFIEVAFDPDAYQKMTDGIR
jgi:thiamine pyrophosphate-dependent acetolactate synthase large subunit-like protein